MMTQTEAFLLQQKVLAQVSRELSDVATQYYVPRALVDAAEAFARRATVLMMESLRDTGVIK